MIKPYTDKQCTMIANNILAAINDIEKLNNQGYKFLNLCSGFIAHYDIYGFKAFYSSNSLMKDIKYNANYNQWNNFKPNDRDYDYYMSKKRIYNMILEKL